MNNEEFQKLVLNALGNIQSNQINLIEVMNLKNGEITMFNNSKHISEALNPKESDSKKRVNKAVEEKQ